MQLCIQAEAGTGVKAVLAEWDGISWKLKRQAGQTNSGPTNTPKNRMTNNNAERVLKIEHVYG